MTEGGAIPPLVPDFVHSVIGEGVVTFPIFFNQNHTHMKVLIEIIKGRRVQGEKLPEQTETISYPSEPISFADWCRIFNVSAMSDYKPF